MQPTHPQVHPAIYLFLDVEHFLIFSLVGSIAIASPTTCGRHLSGHGSRCGKSQISRRQALLLHTWSHGQRVEIILSQRSCTPGTRTHTGQAHE